MTDPLPSLPRSETREKTARHQWIALAIGLVLVLLVMSVFVLGQVLKGYVIYPRFLGNRVELHDVLIVFALLARGAAFGFLGVLLAVPVTGALGVLARFWIRRYLQSPHYLDPPPGDDRFTP